MYRKIISCLLSICMCLSLPSGALAADGMVSCVFDGFVVEYPEHLQLREHEMGLFFLDDDGFIQINTQLFPESFSTPVSEWLEKGVVDYLKQTSSEDFTYTSDGEILKIGDLDFVFLQAQKGDSPFYQYFAMIDHMLILFTVKGDVCNSAMPDVLKSLHKADTADLEHKQYTSDINDKHITRTKADGSEELVGFRAEPTLVTYASFMKGYLEFMLQAIGLEKPDDFPISRCFFSDGQYVRIFGDRGMITKFYTAGPKETDTLTGVYFTANPSIVSEELMTSAVAACLLASYNGFGAMHQETVNRFQDLMTSGFPEINGDEAFWTENGFEVFLGKTDSEYCVKIQWLGNIEDQTLPVPDIQSDTLPPLDHPNLTVEKFIERHNRMCQMLTDSTAFEITPLPATGAENGMVVVNCTATEILRIKLYRQDQNASSPVIHIRLECDYNAPRLLEVECLAALYAASEINDEEMIDIISLGDDTMILWESLCQMKPYVSVNGVALQAGENGEKMFAALYGDDR